MGKLKTENGAGELERKGVILFLLAGALTELEQGIYPDLGRSCTSTQKSMKHINSSELDLAILIAVILILIF